MSGHQSPVLAIADALRGTAAGSKLVRELTAAPDLDGWAIVERLLKDFAPLEDHRATVRPTLPDDPDYARRWAIVDTVNKGRY